MINHSLIFDALLFALLLVIPLTLVLRHLRVTESYRNRAELRKLKAGHRRVRHWAAFFALLLALDLSSITALKSYAGREIPLSAPEDYAIEDGRIVVPLESLQDEHLHRYEYTAKDGIKMRFILIKKSQSAYGVGLDACEICGPTGYFERKNEVVCKLCDVVMNKGTIGFSGGCNPIPFPYLVHDQKIYIETADLDKLSYVFK